MIPLSLYLDSMEWKKFEYLENEKAFLDEIKSIHQSF